MARGSQGFSLVEALVATALVSTAVVSLMQLSILATTANQRARVTTIATLAAVEKMEQLQGLLWASDETGQPISDTTSDLTSMPDGHAGSGLSPSPPSALQQNVQGYCDFVDSSGAAIGTGASPRLGTAYVRRWSIEPLSISPGDTLLLQVVVTEWRGAAPGAPSARGPTLLPRGIRLVGVKTRKAL